MKLSKILAATCVLISGTFASANTIELQAVTLPTAPGGGTYVYRVVLTDGSTIEQPTIDLGTPANTTTEPSRFAVYDISGIQSASFSASTALATAGGNFSLNFTPLVAFVSPQLGTPTSADNPSQVDIVATYTGLAPFVATATSHDTTDGTILGTLSFFSKTPYVFGAQVQVGSYDVSGSLNAHRSFIDVAGPGSGAPGDNFTPTPVASMSGLGLLALLGVSRRRHK